MTEQEALTIEKNKSVMLETLDCALDEIKRLRELCARAADAIERFRDYQCNCPEAALIQELRGIAPIPDAADRSGPYVNPID